MAYDETLYSKFITGTLTVEEISQLKETGEWSELEKIAKETESWSLPSFDKESGFENLREKRLESSSKSSTGIVRFLPALAAAASVLLIIGYFVLLQNNSVTITSEYASTTPLTLPDQSTVVLNDGSSVRYDERQFESNREIELIGEALFTVEKGSSFVVNTEVGTIKVLGTSFNVRSWDKQLVVECYTGKVQVMNTSSSEILNAGDKIKILATGKIEKSNITLSEPEWQNNTSRFKNEPLGNVFRELERQYDINIQFTPDNRVFGGAFNHNNLDSALQVICEPMGVSYKKEKANIYKIIE